MKKAYRGAGILFYHIDVSGKTQIALGLRRIKPNYNTWSIPGGKFDARKDRTALDNAIREAMEEGFSLTAEQEASLRQSPRRVIWPLWPFFLWSTFLVKVNHMPSRSAWPENTEDFRYEFHEARWFDVKDLPKNVHPAVKPVLALKRLR